MNIIGNKLALFSMHGVIDPIKCLNALERLSDTHDFNIDELNNISETGGIYVKANGSILSGFGKSDEAMAKYKLVPTGYKFRYSEYPLFAGFIKLQGQWEGCFVGTATMLFEMYKEHYNGEFDNSYTAIFSGKNRVRDISGFGLDAILNSPVDIVEETVYISEKSVSTQLEIAINKIKNQLESSKDSCKSSKSKCKHKNKAQRKAEKLQKHLERIRDREERQKAKDAELQKEIEEQAKIEEELSRTENGVIWTAVLPIEDVHFDFEDDATKILNKKIEDYINDSDCVEHTDEVEQSIADVIIDTVKEIKQTVDIECDEQYILNDLDHDNTVKTEYEKYRMQIKNDIINDIYDRLLIKENWKINNKPRLGFYLRGICLFTWREQKDNPDLIKGNGYTFSEDKKYCIINTGLIDTYGNFIYLIDHSPSVPDFYDKLISIMYNKATLLNMGFDIHNVKYLPMPIKFVDDNKDLIFDAQYDDFDLDDTAHLFHIVNERICRFPNRYANESPLYLCERIKSAIRQAIMISKTDYRYVIPKYDFSRKDIQFLIPLYLDNTPDTFPELTIVVGKHCNNIWNIFTVLYSDDAYDDARLISKASDSWLNIKKRRII